jgi:hypothetical protein
VSRIKKINLETAEKAFATANTPLFLLRKLRADPAVSEIARRFDPEEIFQELRRAVKRHAASFQSAVLPFVLLVALSLNLDNEYLLKSSKLKAPHHAWFAYCCEYLLREFRPTSIVTLRPQKKVARSIKPESRLNTFVISGT